ncbi:RfeD [Verticillium alfalfae VaMs.102]|uniref:RfeD n=1 Tax=Verticillium alfalfae (strain VaMs.102 / ATCC MYA-4576 / FGSC 10136) TaxID=526221 RepID=C9SMG2_VERA1|nr:RfeD [Verticillium alfalfae VaMs.102]EEY19977.1 RfeD [Verticillium alfalfae VaMs.102]
MPPRSSLTSQFSIADSNNEVVCPLRNQDGSSCRKRCIGEKRYRSMQEHIRRAHPEHYIQKLPATEESFLLMISTDPSTRVQQQPQPSATSAPAGAFPSSQGFSPLIDRFQGFLHDRHAYDSSSPGTPRNVNHDEYGTPGSLLPAASAAAALAQLHGHKIEPEWESEIDWHSDTEGRRPPRTSIELPPIHLPPHDVTSEPFPAMNSSRPRDILPSILANSPPGRSSTLPPIQRSSGQAARGSIRHKRVERALLLSLPPIWKALGGSHRRRRQAASAAGDIDEDRTPVRQLQSDASLDRLMSYQVPQSPVSIPRASMPPFQQHNFHGGNSYQASPLQQALTPPSYSQDTIDPFPSVESGESGENFHIESRGLSDSSPTYSSQNTQIYCAACQSVSRLKESYACTECICGLCQACVDVLMAEQGARRKCPRCATIGGKFKPFQLDIR